MKKSFPANINGTVFYIDEDAYNQLNTYLEQIRNAFSDNDGDEIISDIEARISEHFSERVQQGSAVITIKDVNDVINKMGRPSQITGNDDDDNSSSNDASTSATPPPFQASNTTQNKRFYRSVDNKVFGGVLAGLGLYLNWNITILRVLTVVLCLCFGSLFWSVILLYLLTWMIVPPAVTPLQKLEASGQPVTMNNLGQTVINNNIPNNDGVDFISKVLSILGKLVIGFFGMMAGISIIIALWFFICCISGIVSSLAWGSTYWFDLLDWEHVGNPNIFGLGCAFLILSCIIPAIGIFWGACCVFFKAKGASRTLMITAIVLEVIFIVATLVAFTYYKTHIDSYALISPVIASFSTLHLC